MAFTANDPKRRRTGTARLLRFFSAHPIARASELRRVGIHAEIVSRACQRGLIEKISGGLYALPGCGQNDENRVAMVCKRIPHGVICLESALWFHGLIEHTPAQVWVAIDPKARRPEVRMPPTKVVRFSGEALGQGCMNVSLAGVAARVYSPTKTIADCFKYRNKIGLWIPVTALETAVEHNKYNRQKLLRFAEICRVKKLVTSYADEIDRTLAYRRKEGMANTPPVWDPQLLSQQVWAEPLTQVSRHYGVSDVALAKRCRKLGIPLPGRGYWAKHSGES